MLAASLKAITAFITTFLGALALTLSDKTTLEGMGLKEWGSALLAAFVVAVFTWLVPNYAYTPRTPPNG